MDEQQIRTSEDVDGLWRALRHAREAGAHETARAIEGRMRELQVTRRFADLDDAELDRRIAALRGNREPEGMIGHSPGAVGTEFTDNALMRFNAANRENQAGVGVEVTLDALLAERDRRRAG